MFRQILPAAAAALLLAAPDAAAGDTVRITVHGREAWTDTGVDVVAGRPLSARAADWTIDLLLPGGPWWPCRSLVERARAGWRGCGAAGWCAGAARSGSWTRPSWR